MKIFKYVLKLTDIQIVNMPTYAKCLSVEIQNNALMLWALVDENLTPTPRKIAIYGTGNPIEPHPGDFIATVQTNGGSLVWHVFDQGHISTSILDNK